MTTAAAIVSPADRALALASLLARKQTLDPAQHALEDRRAAAVVALKRAGSALAPANRHARSTLAALALLENLAGLDAGSIQRPWLAVRALDLRAGESVSGELVQDDIAATFVKAGSAVATLDREDRVGGILGTLGPRDPQTLTARARVVSPGLDGTAFTIETDGATLFAEGAAQAAPEQLLKAVDGLPSRHLQQGGAPKVANANGPAPLAYAVVSHAQAALTGDTLFEGYRIARMDIAGAMPHPSALVESAALASVTPPEPTYQPLLRSEIVARGILSDVQLETVVYAGQAHGQYLPSDPMDPNGAPPRQGILIGHGTGVGKGRCIAGVMMDNWSQGRRRLVWIAERHRHLQDATRDWVALGGKPSDFVDLRDIRPADSVPARNGILFLTYSLLRGEQENVTRVEQILEWFGMTADGVIVFDECQNLRNAVTRDTGWRSAKPSKQGEAAIKLQTGAPNARVVYASATSASDIGSMGFAVRLGLWGRGTAFPTAKAFFEQMEEGGINALELVARDLKALGLYLAANLSFDGVQYERLECRLTAEERETQDRLADAWAKVNVGLQQALASTGVSTLAQNAGKAVRALVFAQFGMARSRFFQAFLASIKAKIVIEAAKQDLANGHAPVIQITNTYAANAERALAEASDINDVEATCKDIILEYVRKQFPVQKFKVVRQGKVLIPTPILDPMGNPVLCPNAVAERDQLLQDIEALEIPEGPLEQILKTFGPEAVAEVTGRQRRLVPGAGQNTRVLEDRTPGQVEEDIRAFQAGIKKVLVFSTSGAAGSSYDASRTVQNQALRRHYLLQAGWRSDQAIQGLGRTHRSNEVQPPVYILVTTDLWAERRMISVVASGMQKLGALTRGQRHAASQDLFTDEDNLESALAADAFVRFLKDLEGKRIPNLSLAQFEHETGVPLRKPGTQQLVEQLPEVRRFLNAMSGMTCARQEAFGQAYKQRLDEVRLDAIRNDSFDRGIETLKPESLVKLEDTVIHRDQRTGAPTRLLKMLRRDPLQPMSFTDAMRESLKTGNSRLCKNALTGRVACLAFPRLLGRAPMPEDKVVQFMPTGKRFRTRKDVVAERWVPATQDEAESLWNAEANVRPDDEEQIFYVVSGTLLPLWDKMPKRKVTVYRMETDDGERILGRTLPEEWADNFVKRVNAMNGQAIDPVQALEALENGEVCTLANGWFVQGWGKNAAGVSRIEIDIRELDTTPYEAELASDGVVLQPRALTKGVMFLLPQDPAARKAAWLAVVKNRPVVGVTSLK